MSRLLRTILAGLAVFVFATSAMAQQKKRVAVMNFDYATVRSFVASIWGTDQDVGKGVADLLITQLVKDGTYTVVERAALDKILAEQNFSNSDRADATTAAKIGKLLGVNAIIIGSVTQFGRDDQTRTYGGGAIGGLTGRFGIGGIQRRKAKAVVGLTARIVNVDTGEILAVADGKGESTRSGESLLGAGGGGGAAAGGAADMSSSNFANTLLGEAVHQAVNSLAQQLVSDASRLPTTTVSIEGLVADASSPNAIILNVGSKAGVQTGDRFEVSRKVRDIRDPATGKVIHTITNTVGQITITSVDELSSVGTFTGSTQPKVGDMVKKVQ
jgi:curli biogenesis system outer membrane secretion channel CsgG